MYTITYKTLHICGIFESEKYDDKSIHYFRLNTRNIKYNKSLDLHPVMKDALNKSVVLSKSYISANLLMFESLDEIDIL